MSDTAADTSSTISDAQALVNPSTPGETPAVLELTQRAQEIQDLVVVSFLFLEKTQNERDAAPQPQYCYARAGYNGKHLLLTRKCVN